MAKLDEITTFNLDDKTYAVASLDQNARELLTVYLETEEDIRGHKKALLKSQHALASMGNMFRDLIKDLPTLSQEDLARLNAATAIAQAQQTAEVTPLKPAPRPPKRAAARK
jgi:hypothetical protein